jgi:zinc/manganese transport system permease protein
MAAARGVPVRGLGVLFMVLLALTVALSVRVVGVLLIFSLLVAPAATAQVLTARPARAIVASVAIAVASVWGGLLLAYQVPWPPSFFITTLSFVAYLTGRWLMSRAAGSRSLGVVH